MPQPAAPESSNPLQPTSLLPARRVASLAVACLLASIPLVAPMASAQLMVSIDYQGPSATAWTVDPGGVYMMQPGPGWHSLFWTPFHLGVMPSVWNYAEIDAFSFGQDSALARDGDYWADGYRLLFSTDEFAGGMPATGTPSVWSEGLGGSQEAAGDIQVAQLMPSQVAPPLWTFYGHTSAVDGDGVFPWGGPSLGLVEVPFSGAGPGPDADDNIDALDFWQQSAFMRLYFSLDGDSADPLEGGLPALATANLNGVLGSDILVSDGSGSFSVWATAADLGLDANDDIDALVVWENGDATFNPAAQPFDWQDGDVDMVLFSVRRGSAVIGWPDSHLGLPIQEGDVLTAPCTVPGPCVVNTEPAIVLRADSLGLAVGDDLTAATLR
ncbi:MAG: hypothetical protein AAGM22_04490 [Acidobacteriota bacterium]